MLRPFQSQDSFISYFFCSFHFLVQHSNRSQIEWKHESSKFEQFIQWNENWLSMEKSEHERISCISFQLWLRWKRIETRRKMSRLILCEKYVKCRFTIDWNCWTMSNDFEQRQLKQTHPASNQWECLFRQAKQMDLSVWRYWLEMPFNHLLFHPVQFQAECVYWLQIDRFSTEYYLFINSIWINWFVVSISFRMEMKITLAVWFDVVVGLDCCWIGRMQIW